MGEKRRRELHSISPNVPTLSERREFSDKANCSNQTPIEIITISSDEDEPQPKRFNSNQQLPHTSSPVEPKQKPQAKSPKKTTSPNKVKTSKAESPEANSSSKRRARTEPELCQEQQALVDLILSGRNVFYTGSAGCGKSTVLKAFVRELRDRGKKVNIVAPTGRAALDVNGQTFWTYAGWTPFHMKKELKVLKQAAHGKFINRRLKETDVLVIDEISMIENHHFERLNVIMQEARKSGDAFGGVQLVVTGDFCQLPPVKPFAFCIKCGRELIKQMGGTIHKCPQHGEFPDEDKWAFRSDAWKQCNFEHVCLRTIHRQSDRTFIDILEKCRMGKVLTEKDTETLLDHKTIIKNAVKLFSTREEVRRVNQAAFDRLPAEKRVFQSADVFSPSSECDPFTVAKFRKRTPDGSLYELRDHRFDEIIELKAGMRVILLVNLDLEAGLVNGSQGEIVRWENYDAGKLPQSKNSLTNRMRKDYESGCRLPMPVLSGEYTQHREQNIDIFIRKAAQKEWPVVRFDNGLERTIYADCTVNEVGDRAPWSLISRTQIPLVAAWAMSIHKSQGMTLDNVVVDLRRSFEEGQMYVALSRARSLEGLQVENLGKWTPKGNEQVMEFLRDKFDIE